MRSRLYFSYVACCMLTTILLLTGCGLIDVTPDSEAQLPTQMQFEPDTVYVMEGDTFVVQPSFAPDVVNNKALYWTALNPDIVSLHNDTLVAVQEGWARLYAASVAVALVDTLDVYVMEPWVMPNNIYPHEMVVYADVSFRGQPLTPEMTVAAFAGNVIRGVGVPIKVGSKQLYRFRIYNDYADTQDYADVQFTFWLYDRKTLQRHQFPVFISYDGETSAPPSKPLILNIE